MSGEGAPDKRFDVQEMIDACRAEAHRIEGTQKALIEAALRAAPDPDQMRKVDLFDATANFLEGIRPYLAEFREYVYQRRRGRR